MEYGDTHRYDLRILSNLVNRNDRAMTFQVFPIRQLGMTFTKAFSFQKVQSLLMVHPVFVTFSLITWSKRIFGGSKCMVRRSLSI